MADDRLQLVFERARQTKNTIRFEACEEVDGDDTPAISTLYVTKAAAARLGEPQRLSVTVAAE